MIFDIYSNGQGINKIFMNDFEEIYHSQGTIRFYAHWVEFEYQKRVKKWMNSSEINQK